MLDRNAAKSTGTLLGDISEQRIGYQGSRRAPTSEDSGSVRILQSRDLSSQGAIQYKSVEECVPGKSWVQFVLQSGDIVIRLKGARHTAAVFESDLEMIASSQLMIVRLTKPELLPEYIAAYLNTEYVQDYFHQFDNGSVIPNLSKRELRTLPIPSATRAEQRKIIRLHQLLLREQLALQEIVRLRSDIAADAMHAGFGFGKKSDLPSHSMATEQSALYRPTSKAIEEKLWAVADILRSDYSSKEYFGLFIFLCYIRVRQIRPWLVHNRVRAQTPQKSGSSKKVGVASMSVRFVPEFTMDTIESVLAENTVQPDTDEISFGIDWQRLKKIDPTKTTALLQTIAEMVEVNPWADDQQDSPLRLFESPDMPFSSPSEVAELLARLLTPQPEDRIYNPACGSGNLLIHMVRAAGADVHCLGREISRPISSLARMNLALHGVSAKIETTDVFLCEGPVNPNQARYSITISHPPFSQTWQPDERRAFPRLPEKLVPARNSSLFAYFFHMLEHLDRINGRLALVAPHSALIRSGAEARIRRALIEQHLLSAVIGLPSGLFMGTTIPVVLLIYDYRLRRPGVLFIDASEDFIAHKSGNRLSVESLDRICRAYKNCVNIPGYCALATHAAIKANDYRLNLGGYVQRKTVRQPPDLSAGLKKSRHLFQQYSKDKTAIDRIIAGLPE